jgi:hypothetical protein
MVDRNGRAQVAVGLVDPPGVVIISAGFDGDDYFEPTQRSIEVHTYEHVSLNLQGEVEVRRAGRQLNVSGALETDQGPIVGARIEVWVEGRDDRWEVTTVEGGAFELSEWFEVGSSDTRHRVIVEFNPLQSSDRDLRVREEIEIVAEVGTLAAIGSWAKYAASLLAVLALLGLLAVRISQWYQSRRSRRSPATRPGRAAPEGMIQFSVPPDGTPQALNRVSGVVLDGDTGQPIRLGEVRVTCGPTEQVDVFPIATDGAFCTAPLQEGRNEMRFKVPGYVGAELSVTIPHRGKHSYVEVYVCSVRAWVRYLYQQLVAELPLPLSEGRARWGLMTPRQVETTLSRAYARLDAETSAALEPFRETLTESLRCGVVVSDERVLRALTRLVEEVYYSGRDYNEEMIDLCSRLIEAVKAVVAEGPTL